MKKLAFLALLIAGSLTAADYSGAWKGNGTIPDNKYGSIPKTFNMNLAQNGAVIGGVVRFANDTPIHIDTGTVSGNQINLALHVQGNQITVQLTDAGNGQLTGRITTSTGSVYTVTFTR
jgi:hypothetical protein